MIGTAFVRTMARYNAWQNEQLAGILEPLSQAELDADRGAFFGSIQGTLSHLLWGDRMWMSRWDAASERPAEGIADSTRAFATKRAWMDARRVCDGRLGAWADALEEADLAGELTWYSGATGRDQSRPLALCIAHFFNHQTHHRGQVHAMLTAAGLTAPVSDLVFMPENA